MHTVCSWQNPIDCAPVVNRESKLVGMVSERDLLNAFSSGASPDTKAREFMTSNVASFDELTPASKLWRCMQRSPMLRVVIVKDNIPIGVVGRRALLGLCCSFAPEPASVVVTNDVGV